MLVRFVKTTYVKKFNALSKRSLLNIFHDHTPYSVLLSSSINDQNSDSKSTRTAQSAKSKVQNQYSENRYFPIKDKKIELVKLYPEKRD